MATAQGRSQRRALRSESTPKAGWMIDDVMFAKRMMRPALS
jgi:hypothetical protein